jgi:hypothetical protein
MKILVLAAVSALMFNTAFADNVVGRAELTLQSDLGGPSGSIDIWEENGTILGQGFSLGVGTSQVHLTRTASGVSGYSLDRFFNITCGADSCNDQGSAQVDLALERTPTGFTLDGTINFVNVHAVVSDKNISVLADTSFQLTANADGSFSGEGATSLDFVDSYEVELTSSGTLQGLKDPAVFTATILNAFVR